MENPFELILERLDRIENAIQNLNLISSKSNIDEVMDIAEVAAFIKLTKPTIYGLTHQNTIPYYKNGKKLYFRKSEIVEWLFSKRIKTQHDIDMEVNEYLLKNPIRF